MQARAEEEAHLRRMASQAYGMRRLRLKLGHEEAKVAGDRRYLIPNPTEEELQARRHSPLFDEKEFMRRVRLGLPTGPAQRTKKEAKVVSSLSEEVPSIDSSDSDEEEMDSVEFGGGDAEELWEEGLEGGGAGAPVL